MFERIRTFFRRLRWRLFRRTSLPIVVRRIERTDHGNHYNARHTGTAANNNTRFTRIDPAEAAEEIFGSPSHGEQDTFGFSRVHNNGTVPHRAEIWNRQNNSMRIHRHRKFFITASNAVVASPEEITGICSECGGPESGPVLRCARCSAVVCFLHGYVIPPDPHVYCRLHAAQALEEADTWTAYDLQHGLPPEQSVYPSRPWTVAKYLQQGGQHRG